MRNDHVPSWLESVGFFAVDLGLDRMIRLLDELSHPEKGLRFIHTAGSNGKGSVCVFLECALRRAGYTTGLYTSPHLVTLNERFMLNGKCVSDERLSSVLETIRPAVEKLRKNGNGPTYFEITTAAALVLFQQEKVDFIIWETGLGGRLDATNVVTPVLSVITGISLEHTEYLGKTLAAVAGEKAGIIKEGVPVVCGPMPEEARNVIVDRAQALYAPVIPADPPGTALGIRHESSGSVRQIIGLCGEELHLGMIGSYQRINLSTAAAALRALSRQFGFDFLPALRGVEDGFWPARFQFIPGKNMILDGAHNPGGAEALASALHEVFPGEKFHFISGAFADKDSTGVLSCLAPLAADFVFLDFDGAGRAVRTPEELGTILHRIDPAIPWTTLPLEKALAELPRKEIRSVLTGSLHLCGEVLDILNEPFNRRNGYENSGMQT